VIWLNALALIGLAGVVLPVLIHLLARGHARTRRFPSLRFIDPSQLVPTRRTRVQDPILLAVRCAIVALAAFALAQPVLLTAKRKRAMERGLARAIVVDTSASMRRLTPSGSTALDSARRIAAMLAGEAQTSVVIETNNPAQVLQGAAAWLTSHHQNADLAVISDFQRGRLDSSDVRMVTADVGVTPHRIPVASTAPVETQWAPAGSDSNSAVTLLGADGDRTAMTATRTAAATRAIPSPTDTTRAVAIVFPGYTGRRALESAAASTYAPWMVDLLKGLSARGNDVSRFGVRSVGGRRQLLLFTDSAPGSLASARITADAAAALSVAPPVAELEPETLSEREVQALARPARNASPRRSPDANGESDARWLWIAVIALLVIELPLRRRAQGAVASAVEERTRAA